MEDYNKTINVDLNPLETVCLRKPLELLKESIMFGAEAEEREITSVEDLQIRTIDKMLTQIDMQAHKVDQEEVKRELRDYDRQFNFEREQEANRNIKELLDLNNPERLN